MRKHSERCKECKVRVFELLGKIYGQENVLQNHNLQLPNKVEQFKPNDINPNPFGGRTLLFKHHTINI